MEPQACWPGMVQTRTELPELREETSAILPSVGQDEMGRGDENRLLRRTSRSLHEAPQSRNWEQEIRQGGDPRKAIPVTPTLRLPTAR